MSFQFIYLQFQNWKSFEIMMKMESRQNNDANEKCERRRRPICYGTEVATIFGISVISKTNKSVPKENTTNE